jgi:capsid assembly protease
VSAANEQAGIKPTYVTYGDYKAEFNEDSPLTPEAKQELQKRVDEAGAAFVKAVATNRNTLKSSVKDTYGKGRLVSAEEAKQAGMIDGIETLDSLLTRMTGGRRSTRRLAIERNKLNLAKLK